MKTTKILEGFRVTLPKEYCEKWHLNVGDLLIVEENDSQLTLVPAEVRPRKEMK